MSAHPSEKVAMGARVGKYVYNLAPNSSKRFAEARDAGIRAADAKGIFSVPRKIIVQPVALFAMIVNGHAWPVEATVRGGVRAIKAFGTPSETKH